MSALTFELKSAPSQRLDLSALVPAKLAGMKPKEIAALDIGTTKQALPAGDVFRISGDDASEIRFAGTESRCDRIGAGLRNGAILVEGDAGAYLGAGMGSGTLTLKGNAGPFAGAAMSGGVLTIEGDAGERAGGVTVGEIYGMRGGRLSIKGRAGPMLAERMRRGLITVGEAGDYAGARMVAGTIVFLGKTGRYAGYGSKRGSLVFVHEPKQILPTFSDCGVVEFTYLTLLERELEKDGIDVKLGRYARRLMGDMAAMGKGEMLIRARK